MLASYRIRACTIPRPLWPLRPCRLGRNQRRDSQGHQSNQPPERLRARGRGSRADAVAYLSELVLVRREQAHDELVRFILIYRNFGGIIAQSEVGQHSHKNCSRVARP